jgi:hypothetical protein
MIDYWKLVRDFKVGDVVQKFMPGGYSDLSPYHGRVTAVLPGLGFVDVQWPFGNERVSPEELVRVNPEFLTYLPPALDFSWYPGQDVQMSQLRAASKVPKNLWRSTELPPGFHKELAKLFHRGAGEVQAYDELWHRYASYTGDDPLRDEVTKFYRFARNSADVYFQHVAVKTATYWAAQGRQHRATRGELKSGRPNCPRCGGSLRKTIYKMAEGRRERLFVCPVDLFVIKRSDIFGPDGAPVEW